MNKLKLIALAFLFSFTLLSCEKEEDSNNELVNYDFALTANQVVPVPSNSTAGGTIKGTYNRKTKIYSYTLEWNGLSSNIAAIHIHGVADRGFMAIPIAPLAAYPNSIVQTVTGYPNQASGSVEVNLYVDGTVIKEHDLLAGKFYVDIHTVNFPAGEIRGQILLK